MNTIPVYFNDINTNETVKNEHFIRAFHCFFELFSKPISNNENKLFYNTKYLSKFESKSSFLQSSILNNINDDCKAYDNNDITATSSTSTTTNNNKNERNNFNTNNYINHESCDTYNNTHQSLFSSGLQKTFRNHFIIPQYASYMKCEKFNDVLKIEENTNEIPLDLSISSNLHKSLTHSMNTTIHTTPHNISSNIKLREDNNNNNNNNKQLPFCQLNYEYSQRNEHTNDNSSVNHPHLPYDLYMKRKRSYRKNTLVTANDDHISNSNNYWERKQFTNVDTNKKMAHFIKSNKRSNKLEQSPTVKTALPSSIVTSVSTVNHIECSPPGKQPVTRCNHCHVLFPSLYELNNHFIKEHDVILQAEMEHTKSWKSHTIDDSCLQNMRILMNRSTKMNMSGYPCPSCDYVAKWPTELQKHIMVHSKQRPHRCIICGLSYKWKWDLGRHFDKSHNRTMNPYKKNVFNHIQNHNNRLKTMNKTSMKTKKLLPVYKNGDDFSKCNDQLTYSVRNPKLFSTSTYIIPNQQIEIRETLTRDKTIKPIDLTSYTQMDIV